MKKLACLIFLLSSAAALAAYAAEEFLWLEEVEGERALAFAKEHNDRTLEELRADPLFSPLEADIRKILLSKDRLPAVSLHRGWIYNFWQDDTHVRGIWRRTTAKSFREKSPRWETILDLDALAQVEKENWVWKGANCLEPAQELCLLSLSRGGKDASVQREFDLRRKSFVADGFALPEAKSQVAWVSENELLVATDFGPGTLTDSGYPMIIKKWVRGAPLASAPEVFRGSQKDMTVAPMVETRPEGTFTFLLRYPSFYETEIWWLQGEQRLRLPMPMSADFKGQFQGQLLFLLREDLAGSEGLLPAGSLVALPLSSVKKGEEARADLRAHFTPTNEVFLSAVEKTRSYLLFGLLDKVKGRVVKTGAATGWVAEPVGSNGNGMAEIFSTEAESDFFLLSYRDYLTPTTIFAGSADREGGGLNRLKAAPSFFDSSPFVAEQWEATSADGTKIPYSIVRRRDIAFDGKNPTLLYGYGGFEISLTPAYSGIRGKAWLEKGGVLVVANIRGGGEFGPRWHEAALKENRQRAFDDFIAVAEDLIGRKVTSPRHLGIQGGSNGGLLVGVTFTQRPDLFRAVLCEVPLLDMLRYHRLLAGASWMGEYGDPEDPKMAEVISRYSPFQNVKAGVKYPEVFFLTSTKDDRVHPGHARRMVARMEAQGHKVHYFENTEGGHGGSANLEQSVRWNTLEYTYLWRMLR